MPSWPIVTAVSSTKCNWSTDRNTPLALNVGFKINKFVIREQAHWKDRYLFHEQQSAETHFYFEIVSVPVAFHWAGSWAALCCSCLQAFAVLPAPCVGTVPFPPWGTAFCLAAAHGCTSLPSQLKLLRTCWSRKQCWKELQETIS